MKKFFELCVGSRKAVKGEDVVFAELYSANETHIGTLTLNVQADDNKGLFFVKFEADEDAVGVQAVNKMCMSSTDMEFLKKCLAQLSDELAVSIAKKQGMDETGEALMKLMMKSFIDVDSAVVTVPEIPGLSDLIGAFFTNSMLMKVFGFDWVGVKLWFTPELSAKLDKMVADKKKKEEEQKQLAQDLIKHLFGNPSDSRFATPDEFDFSKDESSEEDGSEEDSSEE